MCGFSLSLNSESAEQTRDLQSSRDIADKLLGGGKDTVQNRHTLLDSNRAQERQHIQYAAASKRQTHSH